MQVLKTHMSNTCANCLLAFHILRCCIKIVVLRNKNWQLIWRLSVFACSFLTSSQATRLPCHVRWKRFFFFFATSLSMSETPVTPNISIFRHPHKVAMTWGWLWLPENVLVKSAHDCTTPLQGSLPKSTNCQIVISSCLSSCVTCWVIGKIIFYRLLCCHQN